MKLGPIRSKRIRLGRGVTLSVVEWMRPETSRNVAFQGMFVSSSFFITIDS